MNRTEDDVRLACLALEGDAPSVDDVLVAVIGPSRRRPRRQRQLRAYLAVAATVVAVAAVAWLAHHRTSPPPATRPPADPALSRSTSPSPRLPATRPWSTRPARGSSGPA
jgi:hypothetical protein